MKQLILIGGGGHCKSCIDVIEQCGAYLIGGILDVTANVGKDILGYKIVGTDEDIPYFAENGYEFLITIGQIRTAAIRKQIFEFVLASGGTMATIISPLATVSRFAEIGMGTIAMHHVQINAEAKVGHNNIINSGSLIEHECWVGDHVHISTHSILNGAVKIEDECFIGSNAVIANNLVVVSRSVVGAGCVVTKSITHAGIYVGNPAKRI